MYTRLSLTLCKAVELAEERAEYPAFRDVIHEMHPRTAKRYHEVAEGKVHDVVIGRRVHLFVPPHDENYNDVAHESQQWDEGTEGDLEAQFPQRQRHVFSGIGNVAHIIPYKWRRECHAGWIGIWSMLREGGINGQQKRGFRHYHGLFMAGEYIKTVWSFPKTAAFITDGNKTVWSFPRIAAWK